MPEIDLDKIVEEIKAAAEKRRRENPEIEAEIQRMRKYFQPSPVHADPRFQELELNVRRANLSFNPAEPLPATRFPALKKIVLRLIRPYTRGQIEFNACMVRALNKAWEIIQEQQKTIQNLQQEPERLAELVRTFSDFLHEDQRKEVIRKLAEIYATSSNQSTRLVAEQNRRFLQEGSVPAGFDYLTFEDRFRGSELEIKNRHRRYVDYFTHNEPVLDAACGRGEFLELLKENSVNASGVEINPRMVARCQEKGLDIHSADLFDHLQNLQDESLGGIFAAQVIEHMNYQAALRLISLAYLKMKVGGVLLIETINPASLFVFAHSLHLDPTHVQPYHPLTLEFLCRNFGFSRTETVFSSPVEESWRLPALSPDHATFNAAIDRLNNLLYGPQDYAVIAHK